jgi:hypothetical protein
VQTYNVVFGIGSRAAAGGGGDAVVRVAVDVGIHTAVHVADDVGAVVGVGIHTAVGGGVNVGAAVGGRVDVGAAGGPCGRNFGDSANGRREQNRHLHRSEGEAWRRWSKARRRRLSHSPFWPKAVGAAQWTCSCAAKGGSQIGTAGQRPTTNDHCVELAWPMQSATFEGY